MIDAKIISPGYTTRGALELLFHTDPTLDMLDIDDVYYPYVRLKYRIDAGGSERRKRMLKKQSRICECIVDRVLGSTYEGKGSPTFEDIEIPEEEALEPVTPLDQCYKAAHTFVLKLYIGKEKLVHSPDIYVDEEELFYKKFYIIKTRNPQGNIYYIMVDAVDGGMSILDHEKHIETLIKEGEYEEAEKVMDSVEGKSEEDADVQEGEYEEEEYDDDEYDDEYDEEGEYAKEEYEN